MLTDLSCVQFREGVLKLIQATVHSALERFDAKTGRICDVKGRWRVASQDVIYPMALLYRTAHPDNAYFDSPDMLSKIVAGGDALIAIQDEKGRFAVHKNGAIWGYSYNCWAMYHWLETLNLVRTHLDADCCRRWTEALRLAFSGSAEQCELSLQQNPVWLSNIGAWHAMSLIRASSFFDRSSWRTAGEDYMRAVLKLQNPDGFWPEGGTPSTSYQSMWIHAVGLYYHFTRDQEALAVLERALEFVMTTTYPDGTGIETPDGRCRYHDQPSTKGLSAYALFPKGRRYARFLVEKLRQCDPATVEPQDLVTAYIHTADEDEAPIPLERNTYLRTHGNRLLVRRRRPWLYCLSAYVTPSAELFESWHNRFHCDRQNLLSVWHEATGVLVGGGNSKGQPQFSTFAVLQNRRPHLAPDVAEISAGDDDDRLLLGYDDVKASLRVAFSDEDVLALTFTIHEAPENTHIRAGLTLLPEHGSTICITGEAPWVVDPKIRHHKIWSAEPAGVFPVLTADNWSLTLPRNSGVEWPVYPYNPYMINGVASPKQAVVRVYFDMTSAGSEKKLFLRVFPK